MEVKKMSDEEGQQYAVEKTTQTVKRIGRQGTQQTQQGMPLSTIAYGIANFLGNMEKMSSHYNGCNNNNGNGNGQAGQSEVGQGIGYRMGKDMSEMMFVAVTEVIKRYPNSLSTLVRFLPEGMRPYATEIIDMYKNEPWDKTVEFVSRLLKAKGKDAATGQYRTTIDVAKELAGDMLQEKFVEKMFGGFRS